MMPEHDLAWSGDKTFERAAKFARLDLDPLVAEKLRHAVEGIFRSNEARDEILTGEF